MDALQLDLPLLLDGPTGTELQRRGFDTSLPLWSARALLEAPDLVQQIHFEYIQAGARLITTNSFRTNRRVLERAGFSATQAEDLTHLSVELVRTARTMSGESNVLIAGGDAPVEDCYSPDIVPTDNELREEHEEHLRWLAEAGVDLLLIETMNTVREAKIVAEVASSLSLPFFLSLVTDSSGEFILSGESLQEGAELLAQYNPAAILVNCSAPRSVLRATEILSTMQKKREESWLFGGYANSGEPDPVLGWEFVHTVPIDQFVASAMQMIASGASVIGSCCGTTPDYTKALAGLIRGNPERGK